MAAHLAGRLILRSFFVWSCILTTACFLAAAEEQTGENAETTQTSEATENSESLAPDAENSDCATEQCEETEGLDCEIPLCGPPGQFWVRSDWIMWWTNGMALPPLIVAGPPGTPADEISVVYGDQNVLNSSRSGVRLTIGGWIDPEHRWGIEADWLTIGGKSNQFERSTTTSTQVGRPLYDLEHNTLSYELADFVRVNSSDYFSSTGAWLRYNLYCCNSCCVSWNACDNGCSSEEGCNASGDPREQFYNRVDLIAGYRYYVLGDSLSIHETLTTPDTNPPRYLPPSTFFSITDSFRTRNEFNGSEIGLATELHRGRWGMNILAKMALGNTHQTAHIEGFTQQDQTEFANGIYATRSNMLGSPYTRDQFTVIPQLTVEMSYQLTRRLRCYTGYNIIYWSSVWRSGDQVDLFIDPRNWGQIPDPNSLPLPTFPGRNSSFWAQGLNVGLELRF